MGQNIPQILATLGHFWGHKNTFTQILCVGCTPFFMLRGDENLPPKKPFLTTYIPWPNNFLSQLGFCCFELLQTLLEICHFATVLCNCFSVACDTCNCKFAQLPKTSYSKIVVASDSPYIRLGYTVSSTHILH